MSKIRNIIKNYLTSGLQFDLKNERILKAIIVNAFLLIGVIFITIFTVIEFINHKSLFPLIILLNDFLLVGLIFYMRKTKKIERGAFIMVFLVLLIEIHLLISGTGVDKILWFYIYPIVSFFTLGKRKGLIFSLILIIVTLIVFIFPPSFMNVYAKEVKIRLIASYTMLTLLGFAFEFVREVAYKAKKTAEDEKSEFFKRILQQNEEIKIQNEEIITQREELELVNQELRTLSIAASETDNAVAIFDKDKNLEWTNTGFRRLYGYSLDEFKQNIGKNVFETTSNPRIKEIINECIINKKSVIYQSQNITSKGEMIWVQTTLTPLFNDENILEKLISIDSNIQKLKEAEKEIIEQREELFQKSELLHSQNQQIKSSIKYAQTIQQAILPTEALILQYYDMFILHRPKDIVSGDFYWFNSLKLNNIEYQFCIVADCTGHGVPGAFMSMIGYSILNQIILENKNIEPAKILEELNFAIIKALRQETSENSDGMDICLCRFNRMNDFTNVVFAGAKRPLLYYNSDKKKIEIIKSSRKTIGGVTDIRNVLEFEQFEFTINRNDILYFTTDGYIDQNNPTRHRIGTDKLILLLNENAEKKLSVQKQILENFLHNFMQKEPQRDDITIVALKNY